MPNPVALQVQPGAPPPNAAMPEAPTAPPGQPPAVVVADDLSRQPSAAATQVPSATSETSKPPAIQSEPAAATQSASSEPMHAPMASEPPAESPSLVPCFIIETKGDEERPSRVVAKVALGDATEWIIGCADCVRSSHQALGQGGQGERKDDGKKPKDTVSRRHAKLVRSPHDGSIWIHDLKSTMGTFCLWASSQATGTLASARSSCRLLPDVPRKVFDAAATDPAAAESVQSVNISFGKARYLLSLRMLPPRRSRSERGSGRHRRHSILDLPFDASSIEPTQATDAPPPQQQPGYSIDKAWD